jgi:hypothetical protein
MTKVKAMKRSCLLLIILVLFTCFISCKKVLQVPTISKSIVGKWFITKERSQLFNNGALVNNFTKTNFTTDDFVQYFSDGSGYFSKSSTTSPNISLFKYTLNGSDLMQYINGNNAGTAETITSLTQNSLSIHAESLVSDPNDSSLVDNEIDDYTYIR